MLNAGEPVLVCPYNKAHSIIKSRMQFHLVKCRLQSPNSEKVVCPFDSTHIVPKVELEFHQQICENRIVLDSFLYDVGNSKCPVEEVAVNVPPEALAPCEENWDNDPAVSVLDVVREGARERKVLLNLIGAPKAERKAHRVQERLRFQRVTDTEETEKKSKGNRQKNSEAHSSKKRASSGKLDSSAADMASCSSATSSLENKMENSPKVTDEPEAAGANKEEWDAEIHKKNDDNDDFELVKSHKKAQGKKCKKLQAQQQQQQQQQVRRPPSSNAPSLSKEKDELINHMTKLNIDRNEAKESIDGNGQLADRRAPELKMIRNAWEKPLNLGERGNDRSRIAPVCPIDDFPSLPVSGRGRGLLSKKL